MMSHYVKEIRIRPLLLGVNKNEEKNKLNKLDVKQMINQINQEMSSNNAEIAQRQHKNQLLANAIKSLQTFSGNGLYTPSAGVVGTVGLPSPQSKMQSAYWGKMKPEQRRAEMQRRSVVRRQNQLKKKAAQAAA